MRCARVVVWAAFATAIGCSSGIVTTPDRIIVEPETADVGFSGEWAPAESQREPALSKTGMRLKGPDTEGAYTIVSTPRRLPTQRYELQATIESIPDHPDFWLVDARYSVDGSSDGAAHYPAYAALKEGRLFVGQIDAMKLRERLDEKEIGSVTEISWPFVSVATRDNALRELLCEDPKQLVKQSTAYVRVIE